MAGMPEGPMIKNIAYAVVLFSIILTSILIIINNKSNKLQGFYRIFFNQKHIIPTREEFSEISEHTESAEPANPTEITEPSNISTHENNEN
jgi:hypothetical protein